MHFGVVGLRQSRQHYAETKRGSFVVSVIILHNAAKVSLV